MGTYKKSNRWYIDYYLPNGKRKREAVSIEGVDPSRINREQAKKALSIRKAEIAQGKFDIAKTKNPWSFSKLADRYLEYAITNKRAWQRDELSLKHLRNFFKGKTLQQITPWLIEKYKSERQREVNKSTVNRELDTLRHMLNMAVKWKMIEESPYKGIRHFKVNNSNLRILNEEEFRKLYESASSELGAILLTAYATGMRLGEILNLKWEDVNLKDNYILIRDSKNYESRTITIHASLKETLFRLITKNKSEFVFEGRKTIKRAWQKALRLSGISHCRFHDLRHTFASNLVMNGVDIVTVAELMGHKDLSMTRRYSHPSPQHKQNAINSLKVLDLIQHVNLTAVDKVNSN